MRPGSVRSCRAAIPVRLLDGALGTELSRRGHDLSDALWAARLLLDDPAAIESVHRDYFAAGASVATTASYQASYHGFTARGISHDDTSMLLRRSVQIARRAQQSSASPATTRVAASIGPYGAILADGSEYHGDYGLSDAELRDFHRERMHVLWSAAPDLLACETIPSLQEARAILAVLRELPAASGWMSFSSRDSAHTGAGDSIADVARELDREPQLVAIGVNCCPPDRVESLVRAIRSGTSKPIVAYPNSGEVWNATSRDWDGAPAPRRLADWAPSWIAAGATWIGGCCRSTPDDIRALRNVLPRSATRR